MSEPYRTMDEIKAAYPNEWVLIDRPKMNRSDAAVGGIVVLHSADRDEFDSRSLDFPLDMSAILFMWDVPVDGVEESTWLWRGWPIDSNSGEISYSFPESSPVLSVRPESASSSTPVRPVP